MLQNLLKRIQEVRDNAAERAESYEQSIKNYRQSCEAYKQEISGLQGSVASLRSNDNAALLREIQTLQTEM